MGDDVTAFRDPLTAKIAGFLSDIGLEIRTGAVADDAVLPGIDVAQGALVVDESRLRYPGDLLHEAGHLAVAPPERRRALTGNVGNDPAEEMMAIAWSYAAARALAIDPAIVFHADGYRGGAQALLDAFDGGAYVGLPMLQWLGMAYEARRAREAGAEPFPKMRKWLRETDGEGTAGA